MLAWNVWSSEYSGCGRLPLCGGGGPWPRAEGSWTVGAFPGPSGAALHVALLRPRAARARWLRPMPPRVAAHRASSGGLWLGGVSPATLLEPREMVTGRRGWPQMWHSHSPASGNLVREGAGRNTARPSASVVQRGHHPPQPPSVARAPTGGNRRQEKDEGERVRTCDSWLGGSCADAARGGSIS